MQITYAGTIIAQEPSEDGLDAVQGFVPGDGKQEVQWQQGLRWTDATPLGRLNRRRSITGRVYLSPAATLGAAMTQRGSLYDTLPSSGTLILQVEGTFFTYENAVLESCVVLKDAIGVGVGFELTFLPAGPVAISTELLNKDGSSPLLNKDGSSPLLNKANP